MKFRNLILFITTASLLTGCSFGRFGKEVGEPDVPVPSQGQTQGQTTGEEPAPNPDPTPEPEPKIYYTVNFYGYKGVFLSSQEVEQYHYPDYPDIPYFIEDTPAPSTFVGWDATFPNGVICDTSVHALYKYKYTVTFYNQNGTVCKEVKVIEGRNLNESDIPVLADYSDSEYNYTFLSWEYSNGYTGGPVTSFVEAHPVFSKTPKNPYKVVNAEEYRNAIVSLLGGYKAVVENRKLSDLTLYKDTIEFDGTNMRIHKETFYYQQYTYKTALAYATYNGLLTEVGTTEEENRPLLDKVGVIYFEGAYMVPEIPVDEYDIYYIRTSGSGQLAKYAVLDKVEGISDYYQLDTKINLQNDLDIPNEENFNYALNLSYAGTAGWNEEEIYFYHNMEYELSDFGEKYQLRYQFNNSKQLDNIRIYPLDPSSSPNQFYAKFSYELAPFVCPVANNAAYKDYICNLIYEAVEFRSDAGPLKSHQYTFQEGFIFDNHESCMSTIYMPKYLSVYTPHGFEIPVEMTYWYAFYDFNPNDKTDGKFYSFQLLTEKDPIRFSYSFNPGPGTYHFEIHADSAYFLGTVAGAGAPNFYCGIEFGIA